MKRKKQSTESRPSLPASQPMFRSAAVARMAGMPVSTLRVWEQRNQAAGPTTAPSGHRQYCTADVQRVVMLRQLTQRGHAIGSLAGLDIEQLEGVAFAHDQHVAQPNAELLHRAAHMPLPLPMRVVVVGQAMANRLQRLAATRNQPKPLKVVAVFSSLAQAIEAAQGANNASTAGIDLLIWQTGGLQDNVLRALKAAQNAWRARAVAVAYRFAGAAARTALTVAGAFVAREPADDDALGAWVGTLATASLAQASERLQPANSTRASPVWPAVQAVQVVTTDAVPARLFDDVTLTVFAHLPSTIACECPAQLAQLLMQICSFETYSADCSDRNPADAQLHAYLHRVAATARTLFEAALQRVAAAEGLMLSPSPSC